MAGKRKQPVFKSGRYAGKPKPKNFGKRRTAESKAKRAERLKRSAKPVIRNEEPTGAFRQVYTINQRNATVSVNAAIERLNARRKKMRGNNLLLAHFVLWVREVDGSLGIVPTEPPKDKNDLPDDVRYHTPRRNQRIETESDLENFRSEIYYKMAEGYAIESVVWTWSN
jgi:hypothetical protein